MAQQKLEQDRKEKHKLEHEREEDIRSWRDINGSCHWIWLTIETSPVESSSELTNEAKDTEVKAHFTCQ